MRYARRRFKPGWHICSRLLYETTIKHGNAPLATLHASFEMKVAARLNKPFGTNARSSNWIDYYSSVSGPAPSLGVVVLIVSYSVTRTTPGIGSSITSMIVSSTTGTSCLGVFLNAFFAMAFGGRFFGVARFVGFLRACLARTFPRFAAFLRVATRFFALAMAVPVKYVGGEPISEQSNSVNIIPQQFATPLLSTSGWDKTLPTHSAPAPIFVGYCSPSNNGQTRRFLVCRRSAISDISALVRNYRRGPLRRIFQRR